MKMETVRSDLDDLVYNALTVNANTFGALCVSTMFGNFTGGFLAGAISFFFVIVYFFLMGTVATISMRRMSRVKLVLESYKHVEKEFLAEVASFKSELLSCPDNEETQIQSDSLSNLVPDASLPEIHIESDNLSNSVPDVEELVGLFDSQVQRVLDRLSKPFYYEDWSSCHLWIIIAVSFVLGVSVPVLFGWILKLSLTPPQIDAGGSRSINLVTKN